MDKEVSSKSMKKALAQKRLRLEREYLLKVKDKPKYRKPTIKRINGIKKEIESYE